jgi:hypothetical protein
LASKEKKKKIQLQNSGRYRDDAVGEDVKVSVPLVVMGVTEEKATSGAGESL